MYKATNLTEMRAVDVVNLPKNRMNLGGEERLSRCFRTSHLTQTVAGGARKSGHTHLEIGKTHV